MTRNTKIMIAAGIAAAIVVATQRKKLIAILTGQPIGDEIAPPAFVQSAGVNTAAIAGTVNTMVTSLSGIAGLAIMAMTLKEKRHAVSKLG